MFKKRGKIRGAEAKVAMIEWMVDILVSSDNIPDERLEAFRSWLAEDSDAELKDKGLHRVIEQQITRAFSQSDIDECSETARERWRKLALRLGLNPELNHYRAIRKARLPNRTAANTTDPAAHIGLRRIVAWRRMAIRVAAVLMPTALVVAGFLGWDRLHHGATAPEPYVATNHVAAHPDSVRRIVLADGTRVTLNRHSTLSYNDRREAELGGEAYFEVAKGPSGEPFTVRSGQLTVTVMGTEFNLRAHKEEDSSTLSLYEGRVQLDCAGGTHLLEEGGHEFMLDHSTGQFVVREFDPEARPEWMEDETPICRCSCLHL